MGLENIFVNSNSHIEKLCVADRAVLTEAVVWLLDDWPDRFVRICTKSGLGKTEITYHMPIEPFWFTDAVDQVDKTPYLVSSEEVASAVKLLTAQGKRVNNMSLNHILGRGEKSKRRSA